MMTPELRFALLTFALVIICGGTCLYAWYCLMEMK